MFLGVFQPVHAGMLRPGGIAAIQHDGVGMRQVVFIGGHHNVGMVAPGIHAERFGLECPGAERLAFAVVDSAAHHGKHRRARSPAPAIANDGILAVFLIHALQLVGDIRQRLIPRDALPFVLAAQFAMGVLAAARLPMLALHGVFDAVGIVNLLAQRAAAQASALLRVVEAIFVRIVGLLANDHAIDHIPAIHAHLIAILVAVNGHPLAPAFDDVVVGCNVRCPRLIRSPPCRAARKPQCGGRRSSASTCAQEIPAAHGCAKHTHSCSFPLRPDSPIANRFAIIVDSIKEES